jgi:hypothetical protein
MANCQTITCIMANCQTIIQKITIC